MTSAVRADTLTDEGTAAGLQCTGSAVNDSGIVAGSCLNSSGVRSVFVSLTPGSETVLPPLVAGRNCATIAITHAGLVIGSCQDATGRNQAVIWQATQPSAAPRVLNPSGGVEMNASGGIVGQYLSADDVSLPFYWNPDANDVQAIPALGSGAPGAVTGISDTAVVMGNSETDTGAIHAFKWTEAGGMTDLGTLAGGSSSSISMLSSNGCFAAGTSEIAGHADHAFTDTLCTSSSAKRSISSLAPSTTGLATDLKPIRIIGVKQLEEWLRLLSANI
ncbi:hypothetical protein [Trinickia mobilis]|uniref:hypothetical protein n=1 Tax=Trinickia mobilis TaxID=2816356 RepID=UPI001A8CF380|nr:hypothetical protein [Trinickia mobilis]